MASKKEQFKNGNRIAYETSVEFVGFAAVVILLVLGIFKAGEVGLSVAAHTRDAFIAAVAERVQEKNRDKWTEVVTRTCTKNGLLTICNY